MVQQTCRFAYKFHSHCTFYVHNDHFGDLSTLVAKFFDRFFSFCQAFFNEDYVTKNPGHKPFMDELKELIVDQVFIEELFYNVRSNTVSF